MITSCKRILLWLTVFFTGVTLAGCNVDEDESDCLENLSITFRFTKNGQNRFDTDVSSISLFVFDEDGLFVGRWDEYDSSKLTGNYSMILPLEPGKYSLVAWGGLNRDHYYICRQGEDHSNASIPVVGRTHIDELLVRIMCDNRNESGTTNHYVGFISTDQFFGDKTNVELTADNNEIIIDLVKNTKQINLTVKGMPESETRINPYSTIDMSFRSPNGGSDFKNELEYSGNTFIYSLQNMNTPASKTFSAEIHTLRMLFGNGHKLRMWDNTGNTLFYEADLLEDFIRKSPTYGTQAAVDAEDLFNITIEMKTDEGDTHVAVKVTVNGWKVYDSESEIQ